uniref:non-specific serine/threonine protein kinase n=1 Tax=Compsopogon caeruleus TaxID=31354 RepID=A0A7S1TGK5_9RHOD
MSELVQSVPFDLRRVSESELVRVPVRKSLNFSRRTKVPGKDGVVAAATMADLERDGDKTWDEIANRSFIRKTSAQINKIFGGWKKNGQRNSSFKKIERQNAPKLTRATSFQISDRSSVRADSFAFTRKLIPMASGRCLVRRGKKMMTSWDFHWVELRGSILFFFREEVDEWTADADTKLKQIASIAGATIKKVGEGGKNDSIKIKRDGVSICMRFSTSNELDKWYIALQKQSLQGSCTLSDFEVIAPIGKGAAGKVFLVRHEGTGETLALKVIDKAASVFDSQSSFRHSVDERFLMEQTCGHPFFVQLRYAFQTKDKLYLVSDFCEGGDLFYFLHSNQRPLNEIEARRVLAEILLALERLHQLGFVYRDLKPENVLLDNNGHVRLADFGLCKKLEGGRRMGRTSTICGTHAYVAPEMIRGSLYGVSVDLWTMGIFLYHILVGRPPFDARSIEDVRKNLNAWDIKYYGEVMSPVTISLLQGLLDLDAMTRLGCSKRGIDELRSHPFFDDIDWDGVLNRQLGEGNLFPDGSKTQDDILRNFNPDEWAHVEMDEDIWELEFTDRGLWPPVVVEKHPLDPRFIVGYDFAPSNGVGANVIQSSSISVDVEE